VTALAQLGERSKVGLKKGDPDIQTEKSTARAERKNDVAILHLRKEGSVRKISSLQRSEDRSHKCDPKNEKVGSQGLIS